MKAQTIFNLICLLVMSTLFFIIPAIKWLMIANGINLIGPIIFIALCVWIVGLLVYVMVD